MEAKDLLHLFIKKELLTKFDEIHYTSTNGSEKPSLAVSNNSNVLPLQYPSLINRLLVCA